MNINLWDTREHALDYIERRENSIPHRAEGEAAMLEHLPAKASRILDIGTGAGRLIGIAKQRWPQVEAVGIDFSPPMLELARARFTGDSFVTIIEHNLDKPLPKLGVFDVVMSSFAIHHVTHERKRSLYGEVFDMLVPGGVFCNLEHVASPIERLHHEFLKSMDISPENDDPSNKLLDM